MATKRPGSSAKKAARARRDAPAKAAPRKSAKKTQSKKTNVLADALAAASWAEADRSLAQGLGDLAALESCVDALSREVDGLRANVELIEERMLLARQSLEHAARVRGLERFGVVGAVEPFDPRRHEIEGASSRTPAMVRIRAQGLSRGAGAGASIMLKARAAPAPQRARAGSRRRD